jgi:hypothetical protein
MSEESFSATTEKVKDRFSATQQLVEPLSVTTAEDHFLRLVAQQKETWSETTLTFYSSKLLEAALAKHAEALVHSAEASDRYAASLTKATWVLAGATIILAVATIALLFKPGL